MKKNHYDITPCALPGTRKTTARLKVVRHLRPERSEAVVIPDQPNVLGIPLTQGQMAIIDTKDRALVTKFKWQAQRSRGCQYSWYAVGYVSGRALSMHRLIMGLTWGDPRQVDHRDGNGLNNRRGNLRIATHAENMRNRALQANNTSGFRGVRKIHSGWRAKIKHNNKWVQIGIFNNPLDAARAYDAKAKELFGEFARLNLNTEGGIAGGSSTTPA